MTRAASRLRPAVLAAVLAAFSGCAEEVPPALDLETPFSVWGQLDPSSSRQSIRVASILPSLDAREPDVLDVSATSVNLRTGSEVAWSDSLVTFPDGSRGHVFVAHFQPEYGDPYLFRLRTGDGNEITARVDVPPLATPIPDPRATDERYPSVRMVAAPRVVGTTIVYDVIRSGLPFDTLREAVTDIDAPRRFDFGWTVPARLGLHGRTLDQRIARLEIQFYDVIGIRFTGAIADENWAAPYPMAFSRELLIQPGVVSNVKNGYGYVGAAYSFDVEWPYDPLVIQQAGFYYRDSGYRPDPDQ